jgi:DNA-binding transcriptional regulator YdaS (Cro superfamily)
MKRLLDLMEKTGQAHIAKSLGVSVKTVSAWKRGRNKITDKRAIQIEKVLGIPRAQLRPDLWGEDHAA